MAAEGDAIRPFSFDFPQEALSTCASASTPQSTEVETVTDDSQGVQLATIQKLARYWGTDYDWRKCDS
jgi:hypothetical protein